MPASHAIETIEMGERGQISVPAGYRKHHKLAKGSQLLLSQLGDALVVVPHDPHLEDLAGRIERALAGEGISVERALKNLGRVRRRRFRRLYGER